jgi:flavodoxin
MNVTIIYESHQGNTAFLAHAMATLECQNAVQLARMDHIGRALEPVPDLLILGGPAPDFEGALNFLPVIKHLPRTVLAWSAVAVFDTQLRHPRVWAESTASVLARAIHQLGAPLITPPESFFLQTRDGPLDDGELSRAIRWLEEVSARCQLSTPDRLWRNRVKHVPGCDLAVT